MEGAANRLLYESVIRTLHAQSFSRSSSQACNVLSDLLQRYLRLVALTCAKHANHAGRSDLTALDALASLEELGMSLPELKQFQEVEGKDLSRYAYISQRRQLDLREFESHNREGMYYDTEDEQQLVFERVLTPPLGMDEDVEDDPMDDDDDTGPTQVGEASPLPTKGVFHISAPNAAPILSFQRSPPLPPSPISNPSSPTGPRKRMRLNTWEPPDHVPSFFPPFPIETMPTPELTPNAAAAESQPSATPQPERLSPSPPPAAVADKASYLASVPYESSTISSKSVNHLPKPPEKTKWKTKASETHFALLNAQHHFLTNPPPPPATQRPSRHTVALALLQTSRQRYDPPDTLYGGSEPNKMRALAPGPTFPVALHPEDQKRGAFLPQPTRSVVTGESLAPLVSLQPSRLPYVARNVLPPSILRRTTRLAPPPPLVRDGRKLTYGNGIPAMWNSGNSSGEMVNGKGKEKRDTKEADDTKLSDALMFATWDWEAKDFKAPLGTKRGRPPVMGRMKSEHSFQPL